MYSYFFLEKTHSVPGYPGTSLLRSTTQIPGYSVFQDVVQLCHDKFNNIDNISAIVHLKILLLNLVLNTAVPMSIRF